jgi:hypothetical protein
MTKTWDFKITPPDGTVTTRTGLSQAEAMALIGELMHGRAPVERVGAGAETGEPVVAQAA